MQKYLFCVAVLPSALKVPALENRCPTCSEKRHRKWTCPACIAVELAEAPEVKLQRCTPRRANFYGLVVAFTNLTPCYGTLLLFHLKQHSDQMQIKFTRWKNQFSERERKAVTRFHADVRLTSEFASVDFVTQ